jgi:hypothetical protein
MHVGEIEAELRQHYFHVCNEAELQAGIAEVLKKSGVKFEREFRLQKSDIIDFYLPEQKAGIEVKVDGSMSEVARQIDRYAVSGQIEILLLMTTKSRHLFIPRMLRGKPVIVIAQRIL